MDYAARDRLSEDELAQRLQHPRTQAEMRTLYAEAYLSVVETIRRHGEVKIWSTLADY